MRKSNFIYTHKKCSAFPVSILTKPTNIRQHYIHTYCAEHHQNLTVDVGGTDTN